MVGGDALTAPRTMSVLEDAPGLMDALAAERTPRFLATRSPEGEPNVVPCLSLRPADDAEDVVFFGNFLLRKTIANLERDPRVAILVLTPSLAGWVLRGDFLEFQRTGPYVARQNDSRMLRYNAYTGIRNAGLIRVRAVERTFRLSRARTAVDFMLARLAAARGSGVRDGTVVVPAPARREFARMAAVKAIAWVGPDGHPTVLPALSLQPAGARAMVARVPSGLDLPPAALPPEGAPVAANVLTAEAISYQAKGSWRATGRTGRILVRSVYAGGPPLPGGRVA